MKKINRLHMVWLIALVAFVTGLVLSFQTFRQLVIADKKSKEKMGDIVIMQEFADKISVYTAAKEAYQKNPGAYPVKFDSIFNMQDIIVKENIRASERSLEDNWFVLQREVVIDDGKLGDIMRLIRKAEAERPPWKLVSCNIKSSSLVPGNGRIVLIFEALEQRQIINE